MAVPKIPNPPKKLSPLKAIKYHCKIECCVNDMESWKNCSCNCVLFPYRFGKNLKRASNISPKTKSNQKPALLHKELSKNNDSTAGLESEK